MRKLTFVPVLCLALLVAASAFAWEMRWMNSPASPIQYDPGTGAVPIPAGALVQLIADGGNGVIDDPLTIFGPVYNQDWVDWLAAGTPPIGDDTLVASSDAPNPQHAYLPGYFAAVYINSNLPAGTLLYTRAFSSSTEPGDWYGTIGDIRNVETFYTLPDSPFPDYTIVSEPILLDKQIPVPEPATLLIGATGLLLALIRGRRK